ncbi:MAG: nickel ABC transporter substrate-binding protein [Fretibacterium sp.]|nr:nickel ABC transporter substrate-binding protein [Fretibacterium sp.]
MRKFAKLFCVLCLLTLCGAACAAEEGKALVYSWNGNAGGDLNPHLYSPNQMYAQDMIYEPLVRYTRSGEIEPCLAESWEISPDGKAYTFHLRKGVTFSDGAPWNAQAAKANIDAVMANAGRHAWLGLTGEIEGAEAVDEHTLRLNLKNAYGPTLMDLSLIRPFRFLSPTQFGSDGGTAKGIKSPSGTGPWVHVEARKGEYDLFKRNEAYWGKKPEIAEVRVKVVPEGESRVVALETGEIDLICGASGQGAAQISLEAFKRLEAMGRFETGVSSPRATRALAINSARGAGRDLAVRRAIQHAIDRDAIIRGVFLEVEKPATFFFSTTVPYCDVGLVPYAYDPERARALLDEAGWKQDGDYRSKDGQELAFDICFVGNDAVQKTIAEVVQSDLRKVGIRVELIGEENDSYYKRQKDGEFGMIFNDTWGAPYEPHAMCASMRVPSHADYRAQSGLPMKKELDEKIGQALRATTDAERSVLYKDILTTLHDQAVYFPISYKTLVKVHRKELTGVDFPAFVNSVPFDTMFWK